MWGGNWRACWSEVNGKGGYANGHFESFFSMFGAHLNVKKHTLGLLFLISACAVCFVV